MELLDIWVMVRMLQFNVYQTSVASSAEYGYVQNVRKLLADQNYSQLRTLVQETTGVTAFESRYHLINCRLALWGIIEPRFAEMAVNYSRDNHRALSFFELAEILGCASAVFSLPSEVETSQSALLALVELNSASDQCVEGGSPVAEDLLYVPRRSGFFSIIENLLNALFFCKKNNVRLVVPPEIYWWPYPLELKGFFEGAIGQGDLIWGGATARAGLDFNVPRQFLRCIGRQDLEAFFKFKEEFYATFLMRSLEVLSLFNGSQLLRQIGSSVLYLRAGDKIVLETVRVPDQILEDAVAEVIRHSSSPLFVISDSHCEAQKLSSAFPGGEVVNITPKSFEGYFHRKDENSLQDCLAILRNFCLLARSPVAVSCPSSNLVNAACWARVGKRETRVAHSKYVPVYRYIFV